MPVVFMVCGFVVMQRIVMQRMQRAPFVFFVVVVVVVCVAVQHCTTATLRAFATGT